MFLSLQQWRTIFWRPPFTEKEVFEAISQMKNNRALGPDGFPAEFYKKCWHIIKGDLLTLFNDLFSGQLQLFHLNVGTITLLPKKTEVVRIEQFRPICLLNVSFKIFTKVGTNRLTHIAHTVVQPTQTAFMP
uniref:Reverse transcriptase domain-containing protein n=1 Tax=Triticum urartu TaxID=4572 RepID=A0A8R7P8H2_TRIUA